MATILKLIIIFCLLVSVFSKQLHFKEDLETKNKDGGFLDEIFSSFKDGEFATINHRQARHIEMVTESVIDHLLRELKHQYFNTNYNANSPIRRLIRNLNKEMKRNEHDKLMKEKQKKKIANNKKHNIVKKSKKKTSDMTLLKHQTTTKP